MTENPSPHPGLGLQRTSLSVTGAYYAELRYDLGWMRRRRRWIRPRTHTYFINASFVTRGLKPTTMNCITWISIAFSNSPLN